MNRCLLPTLTAALVFMNAFAGTDTVEPDAIVLDVQSPAYSIISSNLGQKVVLEDFGCLNSPGKPLLPRKSYLVALPPGAEVLSVETTVADSVELPGNFRIMPAPPVVPIDNDHTCREAARRLRQEWERSRDIAYSDDSMYPTTRGGLLGHGTLRKYSYALVSFHPFGYRPVSGRLFHYPEARIKIYYHQPSQGSEAAQRLEESMGDDLANELASTMFVNYQEMRALYQPSEMDRLGRSQGNGLFIITHPSLLGAIEASGFLDWKAALGFNVQTVLTTEPAIAGRQCRDLAEAIREFLRENYIPWGVEYVLLIGDNATVPMRYCFPDPGNHSFHPDDPFNYGGEVPTDYYYADLSGPDEASWDYDGDGFYGEYGQDQPDFLAEVYVGRIPTSDSARLEYALSKLVAFEQDTGSWKDRALHAGAILFFENEDYSGYPEVDGATVLQHIEADLMNGWSISHYSEQSGLVHSGYPWPALNTDVFTAGWRGEQYGVVNWAGHGSAIGASRSVWAWDDGDGVAESPEISMPAIINTSSNLEDDYPSIVFAISCLVGYPEPNAYGRLGVDLLIEPSLGSAAGIVSASRGAAVSGYWDSLGGGAESICYEFNRFMINGPAGPEAVGNAIYNSKFYCNSTFPFDHYYEYKNMFDFNLYGDPSLRREGVSPFICGDTDASGVVDIDDVVYVIQYIFSGGPEPVPYDSGDANCSDAVDIDDAVWLIDYIFGGGNLPCDTDGDGAPGC